MNLKLYIIIFIFFFVITTLSISSTCLAEERILSFHSEIFVDPTGSMIVEETIKVQSQGIQIKRGIYRDFPLRYKDPYGNDYIVDFSILKILKNGKEEPYHTESQSNSIRIYIGHKNVFLKPGIYTYTIKYYTNRQIGFFPQNDEIYWNVTGNNWAFPIDKASARVYLPEGARDKILKFDGYTGYLGQKGKDFKIIAEEGNIIYFETTRNLNVREGFTILISLSKGFLKEPTKKEKFQRFIYDNKSLIFALFGLCIVLIYYLVFWSRVGRDPEKGPIVIQYEPPGDYSPAAMRFIYKMSFDDKIIAASLVNMAVNGFLHIKEDDEKIKLIKKDNPTGKLSSEERIFYQSLFQSGNSITLEQQNNKILRESRNTLKNCLKNNYEKINFYTNRSFFIIGAILSLLVAVISAAMTSNKQLAIFFSIWLTIWTVGVMALIFTVKNAWSSAISVKSLKHILKAVFVTLFSIPFLAAEVFAIFLLLNFTSPFFVMTIFLLGGVNNVFYHLLKAPTMRGRQLMDKIEGFKLFLKATEEDRLNRLYAIEKTPQLFEKYLPYAIALDVENEWAEKFESILKESLVYEERRYRPSWYSGTHFYGASLGSIGAVLSTAISSSFTSASSSGGSSGGGGGGGGGGGW